MLVCIAPSGPIQPMAPVYGPRRTGSSPSSSSIARILGAPVIEPPGNEAERRSKRVATGRERPGDGRDQVLDGGGPLEPAQPRDADGARDAHPTEVVAQDVHDHHVLGAVLGRGEELARERTVLCSVAAARAGALDRVRADVPLGIDREERLRRGGQQRPRSTGQLPDAEIEPRREERRVAGPQPAIEVPRIAIEVGLEPPGQVRLVDLAVGDVLADALDTCHVAGAVRARAEAEGGTVAIGVARPGPAARSALSRAWTSSSRRASRRPSPSSARPASQACPVRRSQATTQSWSPSRSIGRSRSAGTSAGKRSSSPPRS